MPTSSPGDAALAISPDGRFLYATSEGGAGVHVGSEPVGLALIKDSRYLVVADSNRFRPHHSTADLRVIDVAAALAGRSVTASRLAADGFPREMAVSPDGSRLLVTDYQSGQLQAIDAAGLP